jgi:hypothetical protein
MAAPILLLIAVGLVALVAIGMIGAGMSLLVVTLNRRNNELGQMPPDWLERQAVAEVNPTPPGLP